MQICTALAAAPVLGAQTVPMDGLAGRWRGEDTAQDSSPNSNHGTYAGSYASGQVGRAFDFSAGGFVSIPDNPAYTFSAGFSVAFEFKGAIGGAVFLGQDDGGGATNKWFVDYGYQRAGTFELHLNGPSYAFLASDPVVIDPEQWYQLAIVKNGDLYSFFLNGQPIGSQTFAGAFPDPTSPLTFGFAEGGLGFGGQLDEITLYDRALTPAEVAALAGNPSPIFTTQPVSQSAAAGESVTLTVTAAGTPTPTYRWQRLAAGETGWTDLGEAGGFTGVATASLGVVSTTSMSGDAFRCIATNSVGSATSATASLTVITPIDATGATCAGPIAPGQLLMFQVTVPPGYPGMRLALATTGPGGGDADLYVQRGVTVAPDNYLKASAGVPVGDTIVLTEVESTADTYTIAVHRPAGQSGPLNYTLVYERGWMTEVAWDSGDGNNTATRMVAPLAPGDYYFRITTPANGANLGAFAVHVNTDDGSTVALYGVPGDTTIPTPENGPDYARSTVAGANGIVLAENQFSPGQPWVFLVRHTPGAAITTPALHFRAGEPVVQNLGPLTQVVGANSGDLVVGPEGIVFFKTTVPANTPAWALWARTNTANGAPYTNAAVALGIRQLKVPIRDYRDRGAVNGQFLVVAPYLDANGNTYFISLAATPGTRLNLASYQQPIDSLPFEVAGFAVSLPVDTFFFKTYRVDVPVQQIAWDLTATPSTGNLQLSVRRASVPNAGNNDAFAEAPAGVADGLTLAPPVLSDGVWYVTVYTDGGAAGGTIRTGPPIVTDIPFTGSFVNDLAGKSGWRFYRVTDFNTQLGHLGWDLLLGGAVDNRIIALRANSVPSRLQSRSNDNLDPNAIARTDSFDYSSAIGDLQRPGHQADVWYIGIYRPDEALGAFTLMAQPLVAQDLPLDGTASVSNQPIGKWSYYKVTVPAGAKGWDVRLRSVTSGSPRLVVRRDQLPGDFSSYTGYPYYWGGPAAASWPSGYQWPAGGDLTGYWYEADGTYSEGRILHLGLGQPLEPGTYYVGVSNNGESAPMSYTLESRGIGDGHAIPVTSLEFAGGSVTRSDLAPREVAYYKVTIPAGRTSWQVKLSPGAGDAVLVIEKDTLPNIGAVVQYVYYYGYAISCTFGGGAPLAKAGSEHYVLLPTYRDLGGGQLETTIPAGDYYLAVISQGGANVGAAGPSGPRVGTGSATYTLVSRGEVELTALGGVSVSADLTKADTLEGGEVKFYTFNVPAGLGTVQVSLENATGGPWLGLPAEPSQLGRSTQPDTYYGIDFAGAGVPVRQSPDMVTLVHPAAGTYALSVRASSGGYPDASYTVRVHGKEPAAVIFADVAFNNGTSRVTTQAASTWEYFKIEVPAGAKGWDVRLKNVTSGSPRLVVRRDQLPVDFGSYGGNPYYWGAGAANWPSGYQWLAMGDLTGYWYEADGTSNEGQIVHLGLGQPLEPGTYYIGVSNNGESGPMSYTLESRGIGDGYAIPVTSLELAGGSVTRTDLAPREVAYYRVTIPAGQSSWQVKLSPSTGDAVLAIAKDTLPNIGAATQYIYYYGYATSYTFGGGALMSKPGHEHYVLLPTYRDLGEGQLETTIPAGDYYLAVISQGGANMGATGDGMNGPRVGTGPAAYTLTSRGEVQPTILGGVSVSADLTKTDTLEGGEVKFYTVTVPAGLGAVQVSLENATGGPWLGLPASPAQLGRSSQPDPTYGIDFAGAGVPVQPGSGVVTLANPAGGAYTFAVRAASGGYPDASYTVRVRGKEPAAVAFDGGAASVTNQASSTWEYFKITVPAGAKGWDVRLRNVTSGNPRLVVRRDLLPASFASYMGSPYYWGGPAAASWPSGYQWPAGADLTANPYEADGTNHDGRILHLGMGQPLEPGTYYVGVSDNGEWAPMSYTLESRGIGDGYAIPVTSLEFAGGSVTRTDLGPREVAYYKITVPTGQTSWQVRLSPSAGDVVLAIAKDTLPNIGAAVQYIYYFGNATSYTFGGGALMAKAGNEHYVLLPTYRDLGGGQFETTIPAGDYYLAVISQGGANVGASGNGLDGPRVGSGPAAYTLSSRGEVQPTALGGLAVGADLTRVDTLEGGEVKFYAFTVPAGLASVQVSLENRTGNPWLGLPSVPEQRGRSNQPETCYGIDYSGGGVAVQQAAAFVTLANPVPGSYIFAIRATGAASDYPDATYTVRVRAYGAANLNFSASQNSGNGDTHTDVQSIGNGQTVYYRVEVPASLDGKPVIGWRVRMAFSSGGANWRVSRTFPPSSQGDPSLYAAASEAGTLTLAPPFLTTGPWYIEIQGTAATTYTITSENIVLQRAAWAMPAPGENVATPGLPGGGSIFADTGVRPDGTPLPDPVLATVTDQGVDLASGEVHFYAFTLPAENAGLIHAQLIALNGNPDLYVRPDTLPSSQSLNAFEAPWALTETGTEFGSWTIRDTHSASAFPPGTIYVAVRAGGGTNARYRLIFAHGNPVSNGVVQNLTLNGGSLTNQLLAAGDWRYYRVQVPADAPASWQVAYNQVVGDVDLYVRDTGLPGMKHSGDYNGTQYYDWSWDNKNQGPYANYPIQGTNTLTSPPLRPGHAYYLGFRATNDASFNVSSAVAGTMALPPALDFFTGALSAVVVPVGGAVTYKVVLPASGTRWKFSATHASSVELFLEEGTPVDLARLAAAGPHWRSNGAVDTTFNQSLLNGGWPWLPGKTFYLTFSNTDTTPQTVSLTMEGKSRQTEDENNDGVPDAEDPVIVAVGQTLNQSNTTVLDHRTLANAGTLNINGAVEGFNGAVLSNAGTLNLNYSISDRSWTEAGFTVANSGTLNLADNSQIYLGNPTSRFTNTGTIRKTAGAGTATLVTPLDNAGGLVDVQTGAVNFSGGGVIAGSYRVAEGALLNFAGGTFTLGAHTFAGAGLIQLTGGELQLSGAADLTGLRIIGGTVSGTFSAAGDVEWSGGTLGGSGTATIPAGRVLTQGGGTAIDTHTLANAGTLTINGSLEGFNGAVLSNVGTLNLNYSISDRSWTEAGFTVANSGTLNLADNSQMYLSNPASRFTNTGTIQKTAGTGTSTLGAPLDNAGGLVDVQTGAVNFSGGGVIAGNYRVAEGALLNFVGGTFTLGTHTFSGAGLFQLTGGELQLSGVPDLTGLVLAGGTVSGSFSTPGDFNFTAGTLTGTVTPAGVFTWSGGTITGAGTQAIAAGHTLNQSNATFLTQRTLANAGTVNIGGNLYASAGSTVTSAGTLNILGSIQLGGDGSSLSNTGALNLTGAIGSWYYDHGTTSVSNAGPMALSDGASIYLPNPESTFNNTSSLQKTSGTGTANVYATTFVNTGSVSVQAGTLNVGFVGAIVGTYEAAAGTFLNFSSGTFTLGAHTFAGAGIFQLTGGELQLSGASDLTGLVLAGGTVSGSFSTPGDFNLTGGTLTGTVTPGGAFNWSGGFIGGIGGPLTIASGKTLNQSHDTYLADGRTLANAGTLNVAGAIYSYSGGGTLANSGTLNLAESARLQDYIAPLAFSNSGTVNLADGSYLMASASFTNTGTIRKTVGSGVATLSGSPLDNSGGTISVQSGTISINGSGATTGVFKVGPGATLVFAGDRSFAGTVQFQLEGGATLGFSGNQTFAAGVQIHVPADATLRFDGTAGFAAGATITGPGTVIGGPSPRITLQPGDQTTLLGQPVTFAVSAEGDPALSYRWQILPVGGGVWEDLAGSGAYSGITTATLTVTPTTLATAGAQFRCVVNNAVGPAAVSTPATLMINAAPGITTQPANQSAVVGGTAEFSVVATGAPAPTYQWRRDGNAIPDATTATLALANVQISDSGASFDVVVTNSAGSVTATVATLAVADPSAGYTFTTLATGFNHPNGIAVDTTGNVYVADSSSQAIRKLSPAGAVSLFAGGNGTGSADGTGTGAHFFNPIGVACDRAGNLYVADNGNHTIRMITPAGVVTTFAGSPGQPGNADGTGSAARFNSPHGVAVNPDGTVLYVADAFNSSIRKIDLAGAVVTTLAGLYAPAGVAADGSGTVFASSFGSNIIVKITPGGVVTTLAGANNQPGFADGIGTAAHFRNPREVALDAVGNLFVADADNQLIRKVAPDGTVTTIGGAAGQVGNADGVGAAARFNYPTAITVSRAGVLYVAEEGGAVVRRGVSPHPAPTLTSASAASGVLGAPFSYIITASHAPESFDAAGLAPGLSVNPTTGVISGVPTAAGLFEVVLTATNSTGAGSAVLSLVIDAPPVITSPPADQVTIAGHSATFTVVATGTPAPTYQWYNGGNPVAGATGASLTLANVQPSDAGSYTVVVTNRTGSVTSGGATLTVQVPPAITAQPAGLTRTVGEPAALAVEATGVPPPAYQWRKDAIPIDGATGATLSFAAVTLADAGVYDVVISNPAGSVTSTAVTLTVRVAFAITTPPASQAARSGTSVTFIVAATGAGPLGYQWQKNGTDIRGATAATLTLDHVQVLDAADYTVTVTSGSTAITSPAAALVVAEATQAMTAGGYLAGGTVTIANTITYTGTLSGLGWSVLLPTGWSYASGAGQEGETRPAPGTTELGEWAWTTIPASPVTFSYTLNVPAGTTGARALSALLLLRLSGAPFQVLVQPDPLSIDQLVHHSADTNHDFRLSLVELLRVIELYNTLNGTVRTGAYAVDANNLEDGFTMDPARSKTAVVTLTRYHSGDSDRDGKLSLAELLRVIELYNTREGTVRTGQYHVQAGTEDGFATGP